MATARSEPPEAHGAGGRPSLRAEARTAGSPGPGVSILLAGFFVGGVPIPKGSARAWVNKATGRAVVTAANTKTKPWEQAIREQATYSGGLFAPPGVAIHVYAVFHIPRPKGHWGKRGIRRSAPAVPTTKPDLDKLVRTLLDAMTGVLFVDDSQVSRVVASKVFAGPEHQPGVSVEVRYE